eukprot:CAMPEP_0176450884 /NCGR_PEP_ID=MMETSP0127-20121128/27451_1 /TAXON_ID=938130 /ORGANISM="Platyophrya macrostoma, Strain WH" /LENGTH=178 /DNA_ID=CAMNT_0017838723 /DNA_START=38 /DNA_END=574 /DNA_ORIENTATION=-
MSSEEPSTTTTHSDASVALNPTRGRGGETIVTRRVGKRGGQFECLHPLPGQCAGDAAKSVEGWILFVSGLPRETTEGDVMDLAVPHGTVRNIRMNTDLRDGHCVGHAMIEYETWEECQQAIAAINGRPLREGGPAISISPAFIVEEIETAQNTFNRSHEEEVTTMDGATKLMTRQREE